MTQRWCNNIEERGFHCNNDSIIGVFGLVDVVMFVCFGILWDEIEVRMERMIQG